MGKNLSHTASKELKYIGINLIREVKDSSIKFLKPWRNLKSHWEMEIPHMIYSQLLTTCICVPYKCYIYIYKIKRNI